MKPLYPLFLNLEGIRCTVVGGGKVAERKVDSLLECGAAVTLIAPDLTERLGLLAEKGVLFVRRKRYEPGDLQGAKVVISATDDEELNAAVAAEARSVGAWVNVVDAPDLCSFLVPACSRHGCLTIAVSTAGASPALARRIREELDKRYGEEYGALADLLGELREELKESVAAEQERGAFIDRVLASDVLSLLADGRCEDARERIRACMSSLSD